MKLNKIGKAENDLELYVKGEIEDLLINVDKKADNFGVDYHDRTMIVLYQAEKFYEKVKEFFDRRFK